MPIEAVKMPVILDCDTGSDDAFAIAMAIASDQLEVLGVSAVAGNLTLDRVVKNTRRTLSFTDPAVPFAAGAAGPLQRDLIETGRPIHMLFAGAKEERVPVDPRPAEDFLYDLIQKSEQPVTLIPLGPLTNIAKLLQKYPQCKENILRMVLMGGAAAGGNTTEFAEFNIYVDPEAADIVFRSGVPIVMCGIEVCRDGRMSVEDAERLEALQNEAAGYFAREMMQDFKNGESIIFDAVTVAWILRPEIITAQPAQVHIELRDQLRLGQTVCDFASDRPNALVAMHMQKEGFVQLILDLFAKYGG